MSRLAARIAEHFVAPADETVVVTHAARPRPAALAADSTLIVIGGAEAAVCGLLAARALAALTRRPTAVCCVWGVEPGRPRVPSLVRPAASALAARLAERGHTAGAIGRATLVTLDGDEAQACAEHDRVVAALGGETPSVLALCSPLERDLEPEPGACDLVLVTTRPGSDPRLGPLAADRLRDANAMLPVATIEIPARASTRRSRRVTEAIREGLS